MKIWFCKHFNAKIHFIEFSVSDHLSHVWTLFHVSKSFCNDDNDSKLGASHAINLINSDAKHKALEYVSANKKVASDQNRY